MQLGLLEHGHLVRRIEGWSADAARFGIDVRYPLLDVDVVESVLGFPDSVYLRDGWERWVFRRALAGRAPDEVVWRRGKRDSWMQVRQAGRDVTVDAIRARATEMVREGDDVGGCVDLDRLRTCVDGSAAGRAGAASLSDRAPTIAAGVAVQLADFVERHDIAVGSSDGPRAPAELR